MRVLQELPADDLQYILQTNAFCRAPSWNYVIISPCSLLNRWCASKNELLEQQLVSKGSLEDVECVLHCYKNHSLVHRALAALGCDLWKVTSPQAIRVSMYSLMFQKGFPWNIFGNSARRESASDNRIWDCEHKSSTWIFQYERMARFHTQNWGICSFFPVGLSFVSQRMNGRSHCFVAWDPGHTWESPSCGRKMRERSKAFTTKVFVYAWL